MATRLTKAVKRVVSTREGQDLVLTLSQAGVFVREKGRRTEYGPVPYGAILMRAAQLTAHEETSRRRKKVSRNLLKL